ncbi:MAG: hypothetical protein AB1700_01990 [Bacillota bacterium]
MLGSLTLPVDRPDPDFDEYQQVLLGKKEARKVHLVELGIDPEITSAILTEFLGEEKLAFAFRRARSPLETAYTILV